MRKRFQWFNIHMRLGVKFEQNTVAENVSTTTGDKLDTGSLTTAFD